jgi:dienelactone hydrolase
MKKLLPVIAFLFVCNSAFSQKLSEKKAKEIASSYLQTAIDAYKKQAAADWNDSTIHYHDYVMRFSYKIFGDAPSGKRSLYISLHGGGNAPVAVNDQQWQNQKRLYAPAEGVYLVPRAPTNTWNLWHETQIDDMFNTIIKDAVVFEGVDPNKVYILGYSAGGDGLYQLAPRMADHWAAASMMAGHPGDASALPLRNLPFSIFAGGNDSAYNRNNLARIWGKMLDSLQATDPEGYVHDLHVYDGLGHWMLRKDTIAIAWMAKFTRNPLPSKVVWVQDDRIHEDFYWLGTDTSQTKTGDKAVVSLNKNNNEIVVEQNTFKTLYIYLNDTMLDLNKKIKIMENGKKLFKVKLKRSENVIKNSIDKRLDPNMIFYTRIKIENGEVTVNP